MKIITRNPEPETQNPEPRTRNHLQGIHPSTPLRVLRNHEPETQNTKLKTRNPSNFELLPKECLWQNLGHLTNKFISPQIFIFLIGLILLTGCSNNTVFESYHKFENLNWKRFNIQKYEFFVENIEVEYDVYLSIRHIPEIPYKKFLINYTIYTPSGDMRSNDLTMYLYDNEGNKLSECLGDFCDFVYPIRTGLKFSEPGTVKFEIENKYPKVNMPGIIEVGLLVKIAE